MSIPSLSAGSAPEQPHVEISRSRHDYGIIYMCNAAFGVEYVASIDPRSQTTKSRIVDQYHCRSSHEYASQSLVPIR